MKSRLSLANTPVVAKDDHLKTSNSPKEDSKPLNFINPEKFIVQNNFIPVPSILMN
jgi:hypothetical protein